MSTQTESKDSEDKRTPTNLITKESEEPLITEKPVIKKNENKLKIKTLKQNLVTDFKKRGFDFIQCTLPE